ncbi:hypothetical protein GCM10023213_25170 [Prosthecobacter algae]|uniref:Predicted DNA-binding protein ribbon-helix-helix domain-containing protein n=1 Tax=Prosthecobacter algae TaxID=1144682 RepID=A0ABP9PAP5_9BACT
MFAVSVIIVNIDNAMKKQAARTTVTLPPELNEPAEALSQETGVSVADLLRQGMIRVISERRQTGKVVLMQLTKPEMAA